MPWHDDSWKDGYDRWKLASPDEEYNDDPDPEMCLHADYEVDIVDGLAFCHRCGESWNATAEQVAAAVDHQREYAEWCEQQARWRNRAAAWVLGRVAWLRSTWRWPSRRPTRDLDDDVPF